MLDKGMYKVWFARSQELETTVRLGLDLVVLILEDNAYGMIRWKQAAVFLTSG